MSLFNRSKNSSQSPPKFNLDPLQQAVQTSQGVFDDHRNQINAVSADIKDLEQFLRSRHISIDFGFHCNGLAPTPEMREIGASILVLGWGLCHDRNDFRLYYEVFGRNEWGEIILLKERHPLIEAKMSIRLVTYPFLSEFITKFSEYLKQVMNDTFKNQKLSKEVYGRLFS